MTEERESMLLVERGVPGVRVIPLDQQVCMLGASPTADVFLDNSYVSRMHAQIMRETDRFTIRDLDSRNGTYVNGTRLGTEDTLQSGDLIELAEGEVRLRFQSRGSTLSPKPGEAAERGELFVDPKSRDVWIRGTKLEQPLSRKEFDVLVLLFSRRGEACSKDDIAAAGWPQRTAGDVRDQEIEQNVRRLRLRIEPDPPNPRFVVTVRGFGYKHPG